MGRKEKPIATSNRALADLAQWLRDARTARGLTYRQLAERTGCHATTLQRAVSGSAVPTVRVVEAYARGCVAPADIARRLWKLARQEELRGAGRSRPAPPPEEIGDLAGLSAGLWELHAAAGGPSVREMERRAGGFGELPHTTAHRILRGQSAPRDERQLVAFLEACELPHEERHQWIAAWRRTFEHEPPYATATPRVAHEQAHIELRAVTTPEPIPNTQPPQQQDTGLRFAVLGPVRAWRGERQLRLGAPQQRALLAALLLRGGRTATARELIDGMWGEDPPLRAVSMLRGCASRLRRALGADVLVSEVGGYAIRAHGIEVDVATAERLARSAETAVAAGNYAQARELYEGSLAQFSGEPLAGVPGPYADWHRGRLEELRLTLLGHRIELDLHAARHAEAVSELTALTAGHPLQERFRELLMLALYRSGRQAEALAVYADTRRLLQDELGVDPRPELAELQQRILQADEGLAAPKVEPLPGDAAFRAVRPAQLPATVADFTGREAIAEGLSRRLALSPDTPMTVSGIAGVGKTALAVHVAYTARESFPDGQLYVDLQGSGSSPAEPAAVLGTFLRALGIPDTDIPEPVDERAALYRSVLAGRQILILLDNARDAAQIRQLLPGPEGGTALITSRARMTDLAGAHHINLDVMAPDEALLLFTRIAGAERVGSEQDAAMDVVAVCGLHPLAIRITASRLAARPTWTVSALARRLSDEYRRLDELRVGDLTVKAAFEHCYRQLEPDQARAFRLLGLVDGSDISVAASAAVVDRTEAVAEELLEDLVDARLLESAMPGRYRFHGLVRLFARDCAEREEPKPEREAALSRLLDYETQPRQYSHARPTSRCAPDAVPA